MGNAKILQEMSAEQLFQLAEQRKQEELEQQRAEREARLEELKELRKTLIAEHKKALAEIDKELGRLQPRARNRSRTPSSTTTNGRKADYETLIGLVAQHGPVSSKALKAHLEVAGISTDQLAQKLGYLKRQGRLETPERAVYRIPD